MTPADEAPATAGEPQAPSFDAEALALHLLNTTQAAAVACLGWVGRGDKEAADEAAVGALRSALADVPGRGRVVIGEGEKDHAPMLYQGEELGTGTGFGWDLAVDPLEGTNYCAQGVEGAIAVLAATPRGAMWGTPGWYMDKLVVGSGAAGQIDITLPVDDNLRRVATALGKQVDELVVVVLDKPRHAELIPHIRALGAAVIQIPDGDVMGSLLALVPGGGADVALGVGGAPEGVLTAVAARLLGGDMQGRLAPQSDEERAVLDEDGIDIEAVLTLGDLVADDQGAFVATGITNSALLDAPEVVGDAWRTSSVVVTPRHRALFVEALVPRPSGTA
ncbi:MAG: class II fructose-bisphosphatase [Actinobacteria bacterium]|nr:class II fructose-bisphosphatase [Actinomycetota bacterium]MBW3642729.1 class II fructose-bisphosphatase [Actinomycetota bacterium]